MTASATTRNSSWMGRGNGRWLAALIVLLGAAILSAAIVFKPEAPKKPQPNRLPLVDVLPLSAADITLSVYSQGSVQARNATALVAEVAGEVIELAPAFEAGGVFAQGDVLLRIDPHDYQVAVQQADAALASASAKLAEELGRAEVARREWASLIKQGRKPSDLALRKPFVDQARAAVSSSTADLAAAKRKLARTQIRAPYAGMVRQRQADLGQYMNIGTPLGMIFATEVAEIRLPIPEHELPFLYSANAQSLASQQPVSLSAQYGGTRVEWPAHIVRSEGTVDERNRMHYLVAQVSDPYALAPNNPLPPLKVGSFVQARIEGQTLQQVYRAPRTLLRGDRQLLVADADNRLQLRTLTLLRSSQRWLYFQQGTQAGDRAVLTALELPVPGTLVQIKPEVSP
ncbi:efflux RND transporter periplasmic adaptor subunit [Atopomonas sediminilitoris]|uniref:efflux RND transporter periplasmic adaptor subunit n=1 Tax=Atopomonas sediminilitoris TaxID=2919919 RepID=UPI001F4DFDC3|nr:efflux RND transporter periplasmic adaptor subunit [Atopomonas sediminilitoris]MCJ8167878.1 efflux RND transporter periplasmic adaptor subunit [Atopomonas sediminilitoris]